jgi:hypothetical protein
MVPRCNAIAVPASSKTAISAGTYRPNPEYARGLAGIAQAFDRA